MSLIASNADHITFPRLSFLACKLAWFWLDEDFADLKALHVYASGSPQMVYGTLDALVEAGMDAHQMRADVFAYAPRD